MPRKIKILVSKEGAIYQQALKIFKNKVNPKYQELTSKEKTIVIAELSEKYKIKDLCTLFKINIKSYYYKRKNFDIDRYAKEREIIKGIFINNYSCYGYRRIYQILKDDYSIVLSEKVIRRIMKEEGLILYKPRIIKYSSYRGEISKEVQIYLNATLKAMYQTSNY